jgi:hypothetical protein
MNLRTTLKKFKGEGDNFNYDEIASFMLTYYRMETLPPFIVKKVATVLETYLEINLHIKAQAS